MTGSTAARPPSVNDERSHLTQTILNTLFVLYFVSATVFIHVQQWLGLPLYWIRRRWYFAWQSQAKDMYALLLQALNNWRSPGRVTVSGDSSVRHQIRKKPDGRLALDFPKRLILIANHQIYTDWVYLWWSSYLAKHHGHLFVILKDSFRKLPIFGRGIIFFSWIFVSRRWETDKAQLERSLAQLNSTQNHNSMWLLIFPEGTNMSVNTRQNSIKWAEKSGMTQPKHLLLPRTRGLQVSLKGLHTTVDWLYDCTIAYSDVPSGEYAEIKYSLKNLYLLGHKAPHANMHWRRFAVQDIPITDPDAFDTWLYDRWAEKDALLEYFEKNARFPADEGYLETSVGPSNVFHALKPLLSLLSGVIAWFVFKWPIKVMLGTFWS